MNVFRLLCLNCGLVFELVKPGMEGVPPIISPQYHGQCPRCNIHNIREITQ